jgi:hypothetical protein
MSAILPALLLSPGVASLALAWLAWSSGQLAAIRLWRRSLLALGLLLASISIVAIVVVVIVGETDPPWGVRTMVSRWAGVNIWLAVVGVVLCLFGYSRARVLAVCGSGLALFYWYALVNSL